MLPLLYTSSIQIKYKRISEWNGIKLKKEHFSAALQKIRQYSSGGSRTAASLPKARFQ